VTPLRPALALTPEEEQILAKADENAADRARTVEKARRVVIGASVFVVVVPPLAALMGQALPAGVLEAVVGVCWALMTPAAGLALIAFAAVRRTARDAATLMAAILSLIASVLLLEPAGIAGSVMTMDRHAAALEVLALEMEAAPPAVRAVVEQRDPRSQGYSAPTEAERRAGEAFLSRIRAEGYGKAEFGKGFVAFDRDAAFGWGAIYATDLREIHGESTVQEYLGCEPFGLRHAGGRWYVYYCSFEGYD
jgi:hypothetical protein